MIPKPPIFPDPFEGTRYRLTDHLEKTGLMGCVLAVEHRAMKKALVAKALMIEFRDVPALRARFVLEAQLLSQIDHPNVVRVLDAGELISNETASQGLGKGCPYYVMEPLVGRSLYDQVLDFGPLSIGKAVRWARRLSSATSAGHHAGILQRDINPWSVFVVDSPDTPLAEVKLLGFGVDKTITPAELVPAEMLTQLQTRWSPDFTSPEVLLFLPADERSDVFALGLVLDFMLRGDVRFPHLSAFDDIKRAQICQPAPPLDGAILTSELLAIVQKATISFPSQRYQTIDELDQALLRFEQWAAREGNVLERRLVAPDSAKASVAPTSEAAAQPLAVDVPPARGPVVHASPPSIGAAASVVAAAVHAGAHESRERHAGVVALAPAVGSGAPVGATLAPKVGQTSEKGAFARFEPSSGADRAPFDLPVFACTFVVGELVMFVLHFAAQMLLGLL